MLFLGNSNVGKSDLLYIWNHENIPPSHKSTHGLVYKVLNDLLDNCKVHCWDFGGQEYYHATHQLFFSAGALHLLLWSQENISRNDKEPESFFELDYWMRCVEQLSMGETEDSSVETIIIENKIDLQDYATSTLNYKRYQEKFRNLQVHFTGVSIKNGKRLQGLKEYDF